MRRNSEAVGSIQSNPAFSTLTSRQRREVLLTATTALTKLSGGELTLLISALCTEQPTPAPVSNVTFLKSVTNVLRALDVVSDGESGEEIGDGEQVKPRYSPTDPIVWRVRALLVSLIDAGVSRTHILEAGFPSSSYHRVKNIYESEGIKASLQTQKRGRKDLLSAKPEVLEKMRTHLDRRDVSNLSNVGRNVDGSLNRALERPFSRSFMHVDFCKPVVAGGGKSEEGKVSESSLYKYKPHTIKSPSFNPYSCSDCRQRGYDIDSLNRILSDPSISLSHDTSVPFCECMPPKHLFDRIVANSNLIVSDARRVRLAYTRLVGTQIHYCQKVFQMQLKSNILAKLPVAHGCLVVDFGQNLIVGRTHNPTEGTERFLSLCTIFAAVLTHRTEIGIQNLHGLVFSNELKHTAHTAIKCTETFVTSAKCKTALSQLKVLHLFSDRGKHFDCQEFSDFVLRGLPNMFPNILIAYDHSHAAKHGRDIGDAAISLALRATNELSMRTVGFTDPKTQLADIRQIVDEYKQISQSRSSTVEILWYEAKRVKSTYSHIKIDRMEASCCRRATRSKPGGKLIFTDHVRFDVKAGILISPKLITSTHGGILSNPADPVRTDDTFVCSVERQVFRQTTRLESLSFLAKAAGNDLSAAILGRMPAEIPVDVNFDVRCFTYKLREETRSRGRPPPLFSHTLYVREK